MKGLFSVNGEITDPQIAKISPLDRGFLFGDSVFEVFVSFGNKIMDLAPHLDRLRQSAEMAGIPVPWPDEVLEFEINTLLEATKYLKTYIRLVVTRGEGIGLKYPKQIKPNRIIYCFPAKIEPQNIYTEGLNLKHVSLDYTNRGAYPKTSNYLGSIKALARVDREGYDDVLWSNSNGEITEATTSNIFLIGREGDLVEIATPPARSGLLLGITRRRVIDLLERSQIKVTERIIYRDEIPRFDEGLLCSTVRGLTPIRTIDNHKFHTLRQNSIFFLINRLFRAWTASEVGHFIDWNTGEPTA